MKTALIFVVASIGFYLAIVFAWFAYAEYVQPADREGGLGMGVIFVIGPVCAAGLGAATAFLLGGPKAPHQIKVAAGLVGLLILVALLVSLIGF